MDLDVEVSANQTYHTPFVHLVAYHQFSSNEYRKFFLDAWEDICKLTDGVEGNVVLKMFKDKLSGHNNVFRQCPYPPGNYYVNMPHKFDKTFNFGQILPAGRYRLEFFVAHGYKATVLMTVKLYFSVSDQRIEKFWT